MIFSAYQNPPYRKPKSTMQRSSASPQLQVPPTHAKRQTDSATPPASESGRLGARGSSPRRKQPSGLQVDTQRIVDATGSESGGDSPRTRVADRLQDLDLHRVAVAGSRRSQTPEYARGAHEGPRKRLRVSPPPVHDKKATFGAGTQAKFQVQNDDGEHHDEIKVAAPKAIVIPASGVFEETAPAVKTHSLAGEADVHKTPSTTHVARNGFKTHSTVHIERDTEIGETPGCRSSKPPASPPLPSLHLKPSTKRKQDDMSSDSSLTDDAPLLKSPQANFPVVDPSISPTQLPSSEEFDHSSSPSYLTWHDDEITGHHIDTAADDDGEGINGIGFRPTPAIAYARSQRRKQQVNEWRAREAKEARQRRFEKRRGASTEGEVLAGKVRTVRFMTDD